MGYLFCVFALSAFVTLAASYKLADLLKCDNSQVNFFLFLAALIVMVAGAAAGGGLSASPAAVALGAGMAVAAVGAIMAFRLAIPRGPIATTWTVTSLSLVIPVAGSMLIWRELPSLKQWLGFVLIAVSIIFFGVDMKRTGR